MIVTYVAFLEQLSHNNQSSWPNAARKDAKKNIASSALKINLTIASKSNHINRILGFAMLAKISVPARSAKDWKSPKNPLANGKTSIMGRRNRDRKWETKKNKRNQRKRMRLRITSAKKGSARKPPSCKEFW